MEDPLRAPTTLLLMNPTTRVFLRSVFKRAATEVSLTSPESSFTSFLMDEEDEGALETESEGLTS